MNDMHSKSHNTMTVNTNFDTLTLVDSGIVLSFKNAQKREILFSELDKIYMKVYKMKPVYQLILILLPFLIVFFSIQYLTLNKVILVALFTVIPIFILTYRYKSTGLIIRLKDGTVFRKKVPLKLKSENVAIVNTVKREWGVFSKK